MSDLTVPAAAELLQVSRVYVRKLCQRGTLPAKKLGRDWLIRMADVEAWELRRANRLRDTTAKGD